MKLLKMSALANRKLIVLMLLVLTFETPQLVAQETKPRFFSLNYIQRFNMVNFNRFANIQDPTLPTLSSNARFHGMRLEGAIANNIIVGLYANGSLNDSENDIGYTSWGGGIGAVTIAYRYKLPVNIFADLGLGLGCGRFTYSSAFWDGTHSITSDADAIYCEPNIKMGYVLKHKLILALETSYILVLGGDEFNVGAENIPNTFSKGWFIGASIGYQFPFIKSKV